MACLRFVMYSIVALYCILMCDSKHKSPFLTWFPGGRKGPMEGDPGQPLYLSDLIQSGKIDQARKLAQVQNLTSVESYSGFLTVNPKYQSNLFFWYIPAAFSRKNAPVVLWLQGGPGGSSLFGLFVENGPFLVDKNLNLQLRSTAWSLTHHVLYIDNPAGTGFSFTQDDKGYARDENDVGRDLYSALVQFFTLFPELQKNDFYATGESYAGKYVPAIGYTIHKENPNAKLKINLKGLAMGDGFSDPANMLDYGDFLYQVGLVDDKGRAVFKVLSDQAKQLIQAKEWRKAGELFDSEMEIYFPNMTGLHYFYNIMYSKTPEDFKYYADFLNQAWVRKAIHVGNLTYNDGDAVGEHLAEDIMQSVSPWIETLLQYYSVLIYNGQLDVIVAYPLTESFIAALDWPSASEYKTAPRRFWCVGGQLAGYVKAAGNLTQLLVRDSGHILPYDQPKWAFDMINRFTSGKPFDSPSLCL